MRAFITGDQGSLGTALKERIDGHFAHEGYDVTRSMSEDVLDGDTLWRRAQDFEPTVIFHLAGAKHATSGETEPLNAVEINTVGTANVIAAAPVGCLVVVASTCKAADPETAYGASKLVAERIALNAGHSVARFYNIRESAGNVFEIWQALPEIAPVPVTDCWRYFITMEQAVDLLLATSLLGLIEAGRYTTNPGDPKSMTEVAMDTYPGRSIEPIPLRRGDRLREPRHAACESLEPLGANLERIRSPYDAR